MRSESPQDSERNPSKGCWVIWKVVPAAAPPPPTLIHRTHAQAQAHAHAHSVMHILTLFRKHGLEHMRKCARARAL